MKIISLNGSPNGRESSTNIMVEAFLSGAKEAGAETINIFLSEKKIEYCRGCHTCWFKTPGHCIIKDDMAEILALMKRVDVIVLATPLYFVNISGTLKVFIDRLTATGGDPHSNTIDENDGVDIQKPAAPKLVMISNCGFRDRSQFEVISLWIKRMALLMQTDVLCELYVTQGRQLRTKDLESGIVSNYLKLLQRCGKEIAIDKKLSEETILQLEQNVL
jgi:multimeric flavodoxin WrbA